MQEGTESKMRTTYDLPEEIVLQTGETLKPVIGGTLDNKPFCKVAGFLFNSQEHERIKAEARRRGLKYRRIGVLSRNLRGRYDLHQRLYTPNVWSFVQVSPTQHERDVSLARQLQKVIDE